MRESAKPELLQEDFVPIAELEEWRRRIQGKYIYCERCLATLPFDYAISDQHHDLHDKDRG